MAKQKIYVIDTLKSQLDGSAITGYTGVASGVEIQINANNVSCEGSKSTTTDTNLGRTDSDGFYEEGAVQHNSFANRKYSISIVINNQIAADKLLYKYLWQMARSPAIFGFVCELTKYADNPNGTYTASNLSTNILAGEYQYVVFTTPKVSASADDNNIIYFDIEAVLVND